MLYTFKEDAVKLEKLCEYIKENCMNAPMMLLSYRIMENFANSLPPGRMSHISSEAISKKKPSRNFNAIIHQSDIREEWLAFKQKQLEEYAWENILTS